MTTPQPNGNFHSSGLRQRVDQLMDTLWAGGVNNPMDAIEQLKQDVHQGRIDADRLIDVIVTLQRQLESALRDLNAARQRIEELEKRSGGPTAPTTAKVDAPFSMRAEEKRQRVRGKKNKLELSRNSRRGRLTTADTRARSSPARTSPAPLPPTAPASESRARRKHSSAPASGSGRRLVRTRSTKAPRKTPHSCRAV